MSGRVYRYYWRVPIQTQNPPSRVLRKVQNVSCLSPLGCLPVCKACISDGHVKVLSVSLPLSYYSTLFHGSSSVLLLLEPEPWDTRPWLSRRWTVDPYILQSRAPINQEKTPCSCFCWPTKHNFDALLLQDSLTLKGKERGGGLEQEGFRPHI